MISERIAKIILNVTVIAIFIGVFFFTYGTWMEKKIMNKQIDYVIKELDGNIKLIIPNFDKISKPIIDNLQAPNLQEEDMAIKKSNEKLLRKVLIILIIFLFLGIIISFSLSYYYNFSYVKIVLLSLISLIAVAFTEFSFLTFFAGNYRSADPNVIIKSLLISLQKYSV